jgi:hypothetical protein
MVIGRAWMKDSIGMTRPIVTVHECLSRAKDSIDLLFLGRIPVRLIAAGES